jgi:DNA repair exonuclease SbcCD ATPase subunit
MPPREPGTPPLGQLLVQRGVLTSTQLHQIALEERVTGKALGDIILERGLASPEVLKNASADIADVPTEPSLGSTASGMSENTLPQTEEDAEWRRSLLRLADGENQDVDMQERTPDRRQGGLRARAARRLDEYLAAAAADLDARWETLRDRSLALEREAERLAATESALTNRARRLREIGIPDQSVARQIDSLLEVIAERDAQIALRASEAATHERLLAEKEEHAVALAASIDAVRAELQAAATDIARRDEVVARLEQERATHARELANTREQLGDRTRRVSELERLIREKEGALSAAQQKLRELRARRDLFVRDLAARLDDELARAAREEAADGRPPAHA